MKGEHLTFREASNDVCNQTGVGNARLSIFEEVVEPHWHQPEPTVSFEVGQVFCNVLVDLLYDPLLPRC